MLASAVAVAAIAQRLLRAQAVRSVVNDERIDWRTERPAGRDVLGAAIFGIGWAVGNACPGPIAAQVGSGMALGLATAAGMATGVWLALRRRPAEAPAAASPGRGAAPVSAR
jgi:uncharacterized membrane protein YedE/YeeE